MMSAVSPRVILAFVAITSSLSADQKKLSLDQRVELMRGLMAEFATCKVLLPSSSKPLDLDVNGTWDKQKWDDALRKFGPAGRVGDQVQVTHVDIDKDSIVLQINNGTRKKGSWKDHIQIGLGGGTAPLNGGQNQTNAPNGTSIALRFNEEIGDITSADVKKLMAPVLDFDKHSATEQYVETLPPEIKKAIEEKKPIEGMDRDQVVMALGKPVHKTRETKEGVEYEDWIYGQPPGRVMFVTFAGVKVVKVKETYAGLGGTIAETPHEP